MGSSVNFNGFSVYLDIAFRGLNLASTSTFLELFLLTSFCFAKLKGTHLGFLE